MSIEAREVQINLFNEVLAEGNITAKQYIPVLEERLARAKAKPAAKRYGKDKVLEKAIAELKAKGQFTPDPKGSVDTAGNTRMVCWVSEAAPTTKSKAKPKAEPKAATPSVDMEQLIALEIAKANLIANGGNGKAVKDQAAKLDSLIQMISAA
jgi:hypothetical protein